MMATTDSRHHRMRSTSASKTNVPSPPMHEAIMNGDLKKLQQLLKSGDVQLHPVTRETPLHMAARSGAIECLRWLLDNGINSPLDKDRDGSTPGHYCAVYGQLEALKELLMRGSKKKQELVRAIDENGLSILSLATLQDDLSMVTWIVDNFPETGKIKDTNGDLPIHFASAGGSLDMVKLFVRKFGRKYAEEMDLKNIKPVYYAAQNGKLDILKYLLTEVKVDSKAREKGGMTIMHAATTGHQLVTIKWLIEHLGPKTILSRSYDGATPLHVAAAQGYTDLLEYFIDSLDDLSDMNVRDDILATPAHDAAEFGEINSLLVLLKHGADITIKDKESKTPYDLAVEKNHSEMIAMIKDYREKGPKSLVKYDKTAPASNLTGVDTTSSQDLLHRTSQISNVKQEASSLIERRKDETMTRKTSLLQLHDEDNSSADELEQQLMNPARSDRPNRTSDGSSSTHRHAVPHMMMGPQDELYAVVDKRLKKKKSHDYKTSDVESESGKMSNGFGDHGSLYRSHQHNVETSSNFSRPSRVKYYDNESSASSVGSSVSQKIDSGRNHVPGFYPGAGMFPQGMPPRPPMGPGGYPYPPNYQYPYFSAMVAQHYGYPHPHQQHMPGKPKTTGERMHMEALQKSGHPLYGPPMYPPVYPGYSNPYQNRQRGRGKGGRPSSSHSSARSMPVKRNNGYHKNGGSREIGFGPSSVSDDHLKSKAGQNGYVAEQEEFHPPPPPITSKGSVNDPRELQSVDENFIMVQANVEGHVPTQASEGTQLQRAKIPSVYDGRYDQYIETDSEEERVLDEHIGASALAECALILAMGPVCGILGLTKRRKEEPVESVSPAIFAEIEAKKTSKQWSSRDDVRKNEIELREDVPKTNATLEDWADVLGMSASAQETPVTGGYLGGSIRARHNAMSQLKSSSLHLASLANDDDDEDDVLSVVVGGKKASKSKQRSRDSRKSRKKSKESSKDETKTKKRLIVKPSKKRDKEKERDVTLKEQIVSESGPIEVKNTAFDSDSDKEKKKRKKGKKKDKKQPVQTSEEEIDELLTKTQKQFQEIQEMYPKAEESTDSPTENELKELEKMFPQNSETNDSLAKLQKMNSQSLTPQQEIRMQVIQSIIAGNDPELKKQVLALISEGWNPVDENLSTSSSANLTSELEAKIMDAQEKQREETVQQLRSQAEMSESMQQRMQGEMKNYMETIQSEFERQRTMWKQQLDEQKKLMQMEKSRKKKTKRYPRSTSNSENSDDTDSVELVSPKIVVPVMRRTFKADIVMQNPLNWDGYNARSADKIIMPPEPPSVKILLSNVNDPELKNKLFHKRRPKRTTSTDLLQTEEALKLFINELQSEDSDDEFATSVAKPATRKRADVRSSKMRI